MRVNLEFEQRLKDLAADARYSNELIGITVRNHFSAFGGVPAPAGESSAVPDRGSVGSAPAAEAEKITPAVGVPRALTGTCGTGRHNACGGAYRELGDGAFVVCPCVCHSGIPEPALLRGAPREPFTEETLNAITADWNLCCCCGTITAESKWTYWQAKDDWDDEKDKWRPSLPGEGDPMCLCPTCGWEHIDLDDCCSGFYSGTWSEMAKQRLDDLAEQGEWWAQSLSDTAKECS